MKVILYGGGVLGRALAQHFGAKARLISKKATSLESLRYLLRGLKEGDTLVNTAFKGTPAELEGIESGSTAWNDHMMVNVHLVMLLAMIAQEKGAHFVHISTLVHMREVIETELILPKRGIDENVAVSGCLSNYAYMKYLAEHQFGFGHSDINMQKILILRINLPFSCMHHKRNLLDRLIGFNSLVTVEVSMTSIPLLVHFISELTKKRAHGIFNCVNSGTISFAKVVEMMQEKGLIPLDKVLSYTTLEELNMKGVGAFQPRVVAHNRHAYDCGIATAEHVEDALYVAMEDMVNGNSL
jgi:dTDP-4-dehydrorhamnose reductase